MRLRSLVFIALALASVAGGWLGLRAWKAHVVARQEDRQFQEITAALKDKKYAQARALLDLHRQQVIAPSAAHDWAGLEVAVLAGTRNLPQLLTLHGQKSPALLANEDACLLVAHALLAQRQFAELDDLRALWRPKAAKKPAWRLLEIDQLLGDRRPDEARDALLAEKYTADDEAARLSRLALLEADPKNLLPAWNRLAEAAEAAPRNPDVRSFRGQILEAIGKNELARVEYVAAHIADPTDPLRRDQLAEFYIRQGSHDLALTTWRDAIAAGAPAFVRVKESFWHKVVQPAGGTAASDPPAGPLAGLLAALDAPGWADFAAPADKSPDWPALRQEALWSRVIFLLQHGDEPTAASLLQSTPFRATSFDPVLHQAIIRVLGWRANQRLAVPDAAGRAAHGRSRHQFFDQIDAAAQAQAAGNDAAVPDSLRHVLSSPQVFGALFLAAGWREAALSFLEKAPPTPGQPSWLAYGHAQLLRLNRTDADALAFLEKNHASPDLRLLRAETLLTTGRAAEAEAEFTALAAEVAPVGVRAAWILTTRALEAGNAAEARRLASAAPLAGTTTGAELLARAAIALDQPEEAARHYTAVAKDSVEARAWLARRAFAAGDFATARRLTEELVALLPDQMQLRRNLREITLAEAKPPQ